MSTNTTAPEPIRCDWCGEPIDRTEGDQLDMSVFDAVDRDIEGEPLDEPIDGQAVADAVADALERVGKPRDAMLADVIREKHAYRLHDACFQKTALDQLYTEDCR